MHSKNTVYRPDIDGLRAIAVILVLLFHFELGVTGGFVGVDVFFVISGYLITEVIRNSISSGRFNFKDFYIRRFLRLHPALVATLILSLAAAFLLMDPASFADLARSTKYAAFSASNFYFWLNQGYFDAASQTKPLLHTWSLAAEWQFYLIWPFIVWGAMKLSQKMLPIILVALTVGSLAASQWMLGHDSSAAYFMMPFRIFELSIGALMVFVQRKAIPVGADSAIASFGIFTIIASALWLNDKTPFPGLYALIPCIGAAAFIYAGRSRAGSILRLKPMVFIGTISYSVYLIHWPIFVFYSYYVMREITKQEGVALLSVSVFIGWLMYALIEKRFMANKVKPNNTSVIYLTSMTAIVVIASIYVASEDGIKERIPDTYSEFSSDPANFHRLQYGGQGFKYIQSLGAKNGDMLAFIVGDSFAHQYAFGADAVLNANGEKGQIISKLGCIISSKYRRFRDGAVDKECEAMHSELIKSIKGNRYPVIYVQHWDGYRGGIADHAGNQIIPKTDAQYREIMVDVARTLRRDIGPERELIIVGSQPYPKGKFVAVTCIMRPRFVHQVCDESLSYPENSSGPYLTNKAIREFAISTENTTFVDPAPSICNGEICSVISGGKVLYSDAMHLSKEGSVRAAKYIVELVESQKRAASR